MKPGVAGIVRFDSPPTVRLHLAAMTSVLSSVFEAWERRVGIICTRGAKRLRPARDLCDESIVQYLATLVLGESNKSPTLGLKDVCVY